MSYGFSKTVALSHEQAIVKVTEALKQEGFGVLTTIDVKETLQTKLGVEFNKYVILGACNPPFAHRALQAEEEIGLLLPCNIIVYERENETVVSAFNPMSMTKLIDNPAMLPIAEEVTQRLRRAIEAI
ncbi:MAG TPA: ABC transporter ATP-binding protein [Bacteroidetes bacterium]|nr:ABC transporter ATP-binding protein [Bacteroidota bacterium]